LKETLNILVSKASKEISKDILVLDSPTYKIQKISNVDLEVSFLYPIYPEVEMPDYKKVGIKYEEQKIEPKKIVEELENLKKMKTISQKKEGNIEKGDYVTFDFEGFVDGKSFEGSKSENYKLEIGSGQFIPGFEDQMIGLKKGDKKEIKVTFPKNYHFEKLQNKLAIFNIKINEIEIKKLPKLDDEFAKSINAPNVKTIGELKNYLKEVLNKQNRQRARENFRNKIFKKLLEKTKIILPHALVQKQIQNSKEKFEETIKKQGLTMEKYFEQFKTNEEEFLNKLKKEAEENIKTSILFTEIAKKENIKLTNEDYEREYKNLALVYAQTEESVKKMVTKKQMQIPLTNDRVIDLLIKYN
jgi:trigger factor